MRIIKHGRQQPYLGACADCGCEFECQLTDGAIPRGKDWLLVCPECRKLVTLVAKAAEPEAVMTANALETQWLD